MNQNDIFFRLKQALPTGWFKDDTPIVDGIIGGLAWSAFFVYSLIQEISLQTRLLTMTGGFLDFFTGDFFGDLLPRLIGETDDIYRLRIQLNLFQEKVTLYAMAKTLDLILNGPGKTWNLSSGVITGTNFHIYEGGQTIPSGATALGIESSDVAARYGTTLTSFEAMIIITANGYGASGYNNSPSGYNSNSYFYYRNDSSNTNTTMQDYINSVIQAIKPIATTIWIVYP